MRANVVFLRCKNCRAINRVPTDKLMSNPRCGKCKTFLEIPRTPIDVTVSNFDDEVLMWPGVVLVEFWSPHCGHCLKIAPVLDELAHQRAGLLKVVKVNVENEPSLAMRFNIRATPTMILYRNGYKLGEVAGALPKTQLETWIDSLL
ncbi:MAG: thioredoxin TrxC [Nitrospirota bacterium]